MGARVRKFRKSQRKGRFLRSFPISWFSIFLLVFGLVFWIFNMFMTVQADTSCHFVFGWLDGWFDFVSPFQLFGLAIGLSIIVWLVRLAEFRSQFNFVEWAVQAVFIAGLCAAFIALKVHIFPYGTPSAEQFSSVTKVLFPMNRRLLLAEDELNIDRHWQFDYPAPPEFAFREHPRWSAEYNIRPGDIFKSNNAPLWSEYKAMNRCVSDYGEDVETYESEQEILRIYWEEFDDWYALNSWRYEFKYPMHPR